MAMYKLKLMFEWGGGSIWCDDDATRQKFDVGPIEDKLPLSPEIFNKLNKLSEWHDGMMDWSDPAAPSPWPSSEFDRFEAQVLTFFHDLKAELGSTFDVRYRQLGYFDPHQERL